MGFLKGLILVMLLTATSCASLHTNEIMSSWVGKKVDDLYYSWGTPEKEKTLNDGRKVVQFTHSRLGQGTTLYCNATFFVKSDGLIESYDVDGNLGGCNRFFGDKKISTL